MFGFLKGNPLDQHYRSLYARACQCHFENNGRMASLFHSYEATFLFSLASDLGLVRKPISGDPNCCKLRRRFEQDDGEKEVGKFCSALAMLLVRIKLQDDWHDDQSLIAALGLRIYSGPIRRSTQFFRQLDGDYDATIAGILSGHEQLEKTRGGVTLEQYQAATGLGFGYIFKLFARQWLPEQQQTLFEQLGIEVGKAIIAFDCATDWKSDQRRRRFNPLANSAEIHQAFLECGRCLARACWICNHLTAGQPAPLSIADSILRRWMNRSLELAQQRQGLCSTESNPAPANIVGQYLSRLRSKPAHRRGDCDICCAIEACDLGGCAACDTGCVGASDGLLCCEPACIPCHCGECGSSSKKRSNRKQSSGLADVAKASRVNLDKLIGCRGVTCGVLNPAGLVTVENSTHPASSYSGLYIEAGVEVKVVGVDSFGLKVDPASVTKLA